MTVRKSVSLAASFGFALMGTFSAAHAATMFDTITPWDGTSAISPFGNSNTATYGQTFIAPVDMLMTDFTFEVNAERGIDLQFRGEVYSWTGSLFGGGGGQAIGAPLYTSASMMLSGNGAFQAVTVNPNIMLTPGSQYVALLTVSDPADYAATTGTSIWGRLGGHDPSNGGGGFVFYNNGNNPALINSSVWDNFSDFGDSAWRANFAGGAAVPEPGSMALLVGGLISGGMFVRRRRK